MFKLYSYMFETNNNFNGGIWLLNMNLVIHRDSVEYREYLKFKKNIIKHNLFTSIMLNVNNKNMIISNFCKKSLELNKNEHE